MAGPGAGLLLPSRAFNRNTKTKSCLVVIPSLVLASLLNTSLVRASMFTAMTRQRQMSWLAVCSMTMSLYTKSWPWLGVAWQPRAASVAARGSGSAAGVLTAAAAADACASLAPCPWSCQTCSTSAPPPAPDRCCFTLASRFIILCCAICLSDNVMPVAQGPAEVLRAVQTKVDNNSIIIQCHCHFTSTPAMCF